MSILTVKDAQDQCREDPDVATTLLQSCIDGAEASAAAYLNRSIFIDASSLQQAQDAALIALSSANSAYGEAIQAAQALVDDNDHAAAIDLANVRLNSAKLAASRDVNGIVANSAVLSAIRLTLGHLYANREDVIAGAVAVQLPSGAQSLLRPFRRGMMP